MKLRIFAILFAFVFCCNFAFAQNQNAPEVVNINTDLTTKTLIKSTITDAVNKLDETDFKIVFEVSFTPPIYHITPHAILKSTGNDELDRKIKDEIFRTEPLAHKVSADNASKFYEVTIEKNQTATSVLLNDSSGADTKKSLKGVAWGPYMKKLEMTIKAQWHPNRELKRDFKQVNRGEQSRIVTAFTINRAGEIENIKVIQSSGNKLADNEAINAIKCASGKMPLPKEYKGKTVTIEFTFDYNKFSYFSKTNYGFEQYKKKHAPEK